MGSFSLPVAKEIDAIDLFEDMPKTFKSYVYKGFEQLSQIEQAKIDALANLLALGLEITDEDRLSEVSRRLDLPALEMKSAIAALSMLIAFVTSRDDLDDVLAAGVRAKAIPDAGFDKVKSIARGLAKNKVALTDVVELSSLASEVAPSFQRLKTTVELRFGFEDKKITKWVPIVMCHLMTDSKHSQSFFQMSRSDVGQLLEQLQGVQAQLDAIDRWAKERE